jgi:hypothetical protein
MRRLPDWLFRPLDRLVTVQRRIRVMEAEERMGRQDRELRAYFDNQYRRHQAGTCGGAPGGCRYVPCVPRVSP